MIKFNHFNFNVLDLNKSLAFYKEALGLEPVREKDASDGSFKLVYLGDGVSDFTLELTWLKDRTEPYNLGECEFHLAFHVDDYEGIHKNNIYLKCLDEKGEPIEDLGNAQVFSSLPSLNGLLNEETMVKLKAGTLSKEDLVESIMGSTPLKQISKGIDIRWEDPVVPRYNGQRSQRVQCSPAPGIETEKARLAIAERIEKIQLPEGYSLVWQGEKIASDQSMKYLFQNFPLAIILMIAILIMLFKDYRKPIIIFCCIPMIFVGVVAVMLLTGKVFNFVAIVGTLGLIGMLIKNGIVLMDEITLQISKGIEPVTALIDSSQSRLRPVMMASLTTILGMIPLLSDAMFGSLAAAIMGGLLCSTLITLLFIPILYALFFKIRND